MTTKTTSGTDTSPTRKLTLKKRKLTELGPDKLDDAQGGHTCTCCNEDTCAATCGNTCAATCAATCGNTCGATCGDTCYNTCSPGDCELESRDIPC